MKEFNTTGICIPEKHYMVDITNKLKQIENLVTKGKYFAINKPRQYGKTTTLFLLSRRLEKSNYFVIKMSFEGMSNKIFQKEESFINSFLKEIKRNLKLKSLPNKNKLLKLISNKNIDNLDDLGTLITDLIMASDKEIVLMIDEVDKSSNNQLFLDFLGMLRNKYLLREQNEDLTFQSVILASVHDIKNLKVKIRSKEEKKYNSPWNIAVDFEVEMDFTPEEITTMLNDYINETKATMKIEKISEAIYYYTSGHPYLVSKLCQIINNTIFPEKQNDFWTEDDVEQAVKTILRIKSVNFESLIKNLENNNDLYQLVYDIIVEGKEITYNHDNPLINTGELYGIFENKNGILKIHNRIYEQRIYNYMISKIETDVDIGYYNFKENFLKENGELNVIEILRKFQLFIKEQYSEKDNEFLERNGRLLFLAFIKPIINGKGFDFKEVQISQEKRLDVVITYLNQKYIVELKIWRGEKYHEKGLEQLVDYLDRQNVNQGYLISFNFNQGKEYREKEIRKSGKEIFAVWV